MTKRLMIVIILLLNADVYSDSVKEFDPKYVALIEEGNKLYNDQYYKKAHEVFKEARPIEPKNYASYYGAGLCLSKLNRIDEAKSELEKSLELVRKEEKYKSAIAHIHAMIGHLAHSQGEYEPAINNYKKALEYFPDYNYPKEKIIGAYNNLANIKKNEGDYESAIDLIKKAIEINSEYGLLHFAYGNFLFWQSEIDAALKEYKKALELGFNDPRLYYQLSRCYQEREAFQKAKEYMEVAIKLKEDEPPFWYQYGLLLHRMGNQQEAINKFKKAISIKAYSIYYYELGRVYHEIKEYKKAINAFESSLKTKDNYSENNQGHLYYQIAKAYKKLNKVDKTLEYCQKSLEVDETQAWPHKMIGEIKYLQGGKEEAKEYFEKASGFAPESFRIHRWMRVFMYDHGSEKKDFELALKYGLKAFELDRTHIWNLMGIAWCYDRLDEREIAKKYLEMAKKIDPNHEGIEKLEKRLFRNENDPLKDQDGLILLDPPRDQERANP